MSPDSPGAQSLHVMTWNCVHCLQSQRYACIVYGILFACWLIYTCCQAIPESESSSDESESADGDEPGEVMPTHPTALSVPFSHKHMRAQGAVSAVNVPPPEVRSVHSQPHDPQLFMLPPGTTWASGQNTDANS